MGNKAIIYGGTFDPIHQGHLDCVMLAHDFDPDAHIYIVPAPTPVSFHEKDGLKKPYFSFEQRCSFLHEVFAFFNFISVLDIEKKLPAPHYTVNTIFKIKDLYPIEEIYLLIGWDQWQNLHRWHKIKELLNLCNILIAPRGLSSFSSVDLEPELKQLSVSYEKKSNFSYQIKENNHTVTLLRGSTTTISGQEIRSALQNKSSHVWSKIPLKIRDKVKEGLENDR